MSTVSYFPPLLLDLGVGLWQEYLPGTPFCKRLTLLAAFRRV